MRMTLTQFEGFLKAAGKSRRRDMADLLQIHAQAAQGSEDGMKRTLRDLEEDDGTERS